MFRYGLTILLIAFPMVGAAQVYKHVDENGNVTFTDQPPENSERVEIREPNTLGPPPVIARPAPEEPAAPAAIAYEVSISSPAPETVIPNGYAGNFPVSARVSPGLQGNDRLQLLMDGVAQGDPQRGSSWSLTNVFRGAHQLEVVVTDKKGRELAKSEAVTVYVRRPSKNF